MRSGDHKVFILSLYGIFFCLSLIGGSVGSAIIQDSAPIVQDAQLATEIEKLERDGVKDPRCKS